MAGISDHKAVHGKFHIVPDRKSKSKRKVYSFHKADFERLKLNLATSFAKFKADTCNLGANYAWNFFINIARKAVDETIPSKLKCTNVEPRWYNANVRRSLKRQRACHAKMKKAHPSINSDKRRDILENYKKSKRETKKALREALTEFKTKILGENLNENPRAFWSYVREVQGNGATVSSLTNYQGHRVTNELDKANVLNSFFQSVFTTSKANTSPFLSRFYEESMSALCISSCGIEKQLRSINPKKSSGTDLIPARVYKEAASEIAPYLKIVFEKSLTEHVVPTDWKTANVTPIFKRGDREIPSNYRPISLTSISCKALEHIIVSSIMGHLDSQHLLAKEQHGFRKGRSCETQLALFVHDILDSGDRHVPVDAIFLDFRKAFDKVPHSKLLVKLKAYGIHNNVIGWIKDFLYNREQRVVLDGISSDAVKVTSGVPQGSVLGPLLFLLYINDINTVVKSKIRLFADDAVLYR